MITTQLPRVRMIPTSEDAFNKCLWVGSGVVNYKLCNLEYNCEACPFDRVMRGEVLQPACETNSERTSLARRRG
jgi:hypothetical protein